MPTIAIIGADIKAAYIADHAKKMGIKTICFAWEKGAIAKNYVDAFFPISIFEREKILEICKREQINGVLQTTELTIPIAAFISNSMKLNGNPLKIMNNITSKNWVRDCLVNTQSIKQPEYHFFATLDESSTYKPIKYPVIVKPVAEGGKRGINVINNSSDLRNALEFAFSMDRHNYGVIVEQFIDRGIECSVESLSYHGNHQIIQITQKICSGAPHCVELGHSQPANLLPDTRKKVIAAVTEVLEKTGFDNGASHTEVKIVDGDVYLIELNSRFGGDGIAYPLTVLSTGYDYISETIKVCMDIEPKTRDKSTHIKYSGIRFVTDQTRYLKPIYDSCDNKGWLYEKNHCCESLKELTNNDMLHTNYFIYVTDRFPEFLGENVYDKI